jgi:hypothetical protein
MCIIGGLSVRRLSLADDIGEGRSGTGVDVEGS